MRLIIAVPFQKSKIVIIILQSIKNLRADENLRKEGYQLKTAHPFFIPKNDAVCEMNGIELKTYHQEEILSF